MRPNRSVVDAAHEVVRGGRHGDRLARPVEPALAHGRVDRREAPRQELGAERRGVQVHGAPALQVHLVGDRPGDHVARRELAVGVRVEGERRPCSSIRVAPSPRTASDTRNASPAASTVGWNCMNSSSVTAAPARSAAAMPSPVATTGFVVWA